MAKEEMAKQGQGIWLVGSMLETITESKLPSNRQVLRIQKWPSYNSKKCKKGSTRNIALLSKSTNSSKTILQHNKKKSKIYI